MIDLDALERDCAEWSFQEITSTDLAALVRIARAACIYRDDFSDRAWDALIDALREAGL